MCKHMIPIMATGKKWCGKMCLAFLFRVSLIHTNFVELQSSMQHAKIQDKTCGSGGEDFLRVLPYMGMTVILVK